MNASKNKKAVIVGLFTIVGISIFIVGIFALGGQHSAFVSSIRLSAFFTDVNGLATGDNVWYEGVKVGTVKSISLSEKSEVEVVMKIDKKTIKFIHKDAKAIIGSDGLMGNKVVRIVGGTELADIVKDKDVIGVDRALSIEDLTATLQKNNLNLLEITSNIKGISKKIANGEGTVGTLLNDKSLIEDFESAIATIKQATQNTRQLTENLEDYSAKLQSPGSFSNDLVTDTVVFSKLRETVIRIEDVSATISVAAHHLLDASKSLEDSTKLAGTLLHDQDAANNMKSILKNLDSATKKLDEDLEALRHNFFLKGYFKKNPKPTTQ